MSNNRRQIHNTAGVWEYRIGNQFVALWNPTGTRLNIDLAAIRGERWTDIERNRYKRNWVGLKPSDIKTFIESGELV